MIAIDGTASTEYSGVSQTVKTIRSIQTIARGRLFADIRKRVPDCRQSNLGLRQQSKRNIDEKRLEMTHVANVALSR